MKPAERNKKLNFWMTVVFLLPYIKRYRKRFIAFYIGWFIDTALGITIPVIFGMMIDKIVYHQDLNSFLYISTLFVALTIFSALLYFWIYAQYVYLHTMYLYSIRRDIFCRFQTGDARVIAEYDSGRVMTILGNSFSGTSYSTVIFIVRNILKQINRVITVIVILVVIFRTNMLMGLFVLLLVPLSVLVNLRFGEKLRVLSDKSTACSVEYNGWLFEMIAGLRDIRLLSALGWMRKRFLVLNRNLFHVQNRASIIKLSVQNWVGLANMLVRLSLMCVAGYLFMSNQISIGLLTMVIAFYARLTTNIQEITQENAEAPGRISNIQTVYDFLKTPVEKCQYGEKRLQIGAGEICFSDVQYYYDVQQPILRGINLVIPAGKCLGLVGASGCGKSTLAHMLLGLYRPQAGSVSIDGQDLRECSLRSIRAQIGIVSQEIYMVNGTLRDNLLLGKPNASDDEIIEALRAAGLWSFVESLPEGLETVYGFQGIGLSGGQKQRLSIARVYLKNARIVIFDEATSALDQDTEKLIVDEWIGMLDNRTAIIISHRLSALVHCDQIALISHGKIATQGSVSAMVSEDADFRRLFSLDEDLNGNVLVC